MPPPDGEDAAGIPEKTGENNMKRLLLIFALPFLAFCDKVVFREDFSRGLAALKEAHWSVDGNYFKAVDGAIEVNATGGERRFMLYDLPVEPGKSYGGSIMVNAVDVVSRNNLDRGATFFFGMLNADKVWINGGEFPRGAFHKSGWQTVRIDLTNPIPENVRYIQIWVGLEGQGIAQFKNLEVFELDLKTNWSVDSTKNPPTFHFSMPSTANNKSVVSITRMKPVFRIVLSHDPKFPEENSFAEIVRDGDTFVWPYTLGAGKWYVKGYWCMRNLFSPMYAEFEIKGTSPVFKPRMTPVFPNGVFDENPKLQVYFYPHLPTKVEAFIKASDAADADYAPLNITFGPKNCVVCKSSTPLAAGVYDVRVKANGVETTHVFVNKSPAHEISFREDHMMLMDGKPFFPIGTYRDPSDKDDVFDGIHEAGFTVTHSYNFEHKRQSKQFMDKYLGDCQKNGLMAFMGIPRILLKNGDTNELKRYVGEMYDNPGVLTYYLADEPEMWSDQYSIKIGADAVKEACPGIPRTILLCTANEDQLNVQFLANGLSEIYWHDPYPVPRDPIASVNTSMEISRRTCKDSQALWCVLQAFDWDQYQVPKKKPEEVEPKAGKIRCMAHLALTANVQGIIFYWLPNNRYEMRKHAPIQWAEVCSTTKELNSLMPYLVGYNDPQDIKVPAGIYHWCRRTEDGKRALGFVNSTDKPVAFHVNAAGFDKQVSLGPWGVEVLK